MPDGYKPAQAAPPAAKIQTLPAALRGSLRGDQGVEMRDWKQLRLQVTLLRALELEIARYPTMGVSPGRDAGVASPVGDALDEVAWGLHMSVGCFCDPVLLLQSVERAVGP